MRIDNYVSAEHRSDVLKLMENFTYKRHIIDWQFSRSTRATPIVATKEGKVIGFNGLMPVQVYMQGNLIDAFWSCDFYIAPHSRRQGIGKALKARLDESYEFAIALGISEVGQKVLTHTGWRKLAGPRRFVRIMSAASFRRRSIRFVQNLLFSFFSRDYDDGLSVTAVPIDELPAPDTINTLCNEVIEDYDACVVRDWDYLNWRYVEAPIGSYSILLVRNSDSLKALAIISRHERSVTLVDYLGPRYAPRIKNRIIRRLLEIGSDASSVQCITSDREIAIVLMRNGFLSPRSSEVPFFMKNRKKTPRPVEPSWFLMAGDSDVNIIRCAEERWRAIHPA